MELYLKSPTRLHGKMINYAQGELYLGFHFWEKNRRKNFLNIFLNKDFARKRDEIEGRHKDNYVQNKA